MKCIIRDFPISINDIPYKKTFQIRIQPRKAKASLSVLKCVGLKNETGQLFCKIYLFR